jgi:hypothetical protein
MLVVFFLFIIFELSKATRIWQTCELSYEDALKLSKNATAYITENLGHYYILFFTGLLVSTRKVLWLAISTQVILAFLPL